MKRVGAVCVVGAGPIGLVVARALKRRGVPCQIIERHSDVGGLWDIDNPGTPMYESCHFISSKNLSSYFDFPLPDAYPDYPSRKLVHAYIRSFAESYGLRDNIEFNNPVIRACPDGDRWRIETGDGQTRSFDALIACPGANWIPRMPDLKGEFAGKILHSVQYRSPDFLRGKRVLIIGLGNSGADIACDSALVADKTFVSVRRGYHFIPKHFFGVPSLDYFADPTLAPNAAKDIDLTTALTLLVGDATRFGFPPPDHAPGESHPILNTQILYHASHGLVRGKGKCGSARRQSGALRRRVHRRNQRHYLRNRLPISCSICRRDCIRLGGWSPAPLLNCILPGASDVLPIRLD